MLTDILKTTAIALIVSLPSAYFVAKHVIDNTPVPAQVMVVDVGQVVTTNEKLDKADRQALADKRTIMLKSIIDEAAEKGIVVIDADAILKAPAEAYIKLDEK